MNPVVENRSTTYVRYNMGSCKNRLATACHRFPYGVYIVHDKDKYI